MEYAYMGLFSAIFNWIFDKILSPVLNFISGLLETVLSWIFNNVLGPLLQAVLWPIIEGTIKLILEVLSGVLYSIFADLPAAEPTDLHRCLFLSPHTCEW